MVHDPYDELERAISGLQRSSSTLPYFICFVIVAPVIGLFIGTWLGGR
jgi:hypothetical protein